MISHISVKNFKSLKSIDLDCSNLNLVTGLNGMGKSSLIQVLLLLKQSFEDGVLRKQGLNLNGDLVNLGKGRDVLYQGGSEDSISFELRTQLNGGAEVSTLKWQFVLQRLIDDKTGAFNVSSFYDSDYLVYPEDYDIVSYETLEKNNLFSTRFNYLHADRPVKNQYPTSDLNVVERNSLGKHGQFAPYYLYRFGNELDVEESLLYKEGQERSLSYQISQWMNIISPGVFVSSDKIGGIDEVQLRYQFETKDGKSEKITPSNVGFGMTYVLPVVLALLISKPGDILIIENPESHIHPKAQFEIGKLMSRVANIGVQLFVETHSDHILNGVRVAVRQKIVNKDLVKIFFVERENEGEMSSLIRVPNMDNTGRIDSWPKDFFDTWEYSLMELL